MRECPECQRAVEDSARFCPSCGAASAAGAERADPRIGQIVNGKFRIEALAGVGGMGRVYRARHLTLDRPVVLKMLHGDISTDRQIVQRFQREARAASRLNHPNSIAVLDFGESEDGALFMAMELVGGRDLAKLAAEESPLGEARIVRIGAQILSALAEAHAHGIIHRDLKPENVMVEPRRGEPDFVKVLDFGIAKLTAPGADEPKLTQAGLVCGTPEYMSPEQARGAELDPRTDLYSVGVILYQLATGELPFQSDSPVGFLAKHLSETPVPARQRRREVSEALEAVISRAMEKDPARRFRTADEMREALLAVDPRLATVSGTTAPRSRLLFWAFAGVLVIAAAGGGAITFFARRSVAERKGHPDTISPAQAQANGTATGAAPPTATPKPSAAATPTSTSAPSPTPKTGRAVPKRDPAKALALFREGEARRAGQDIDGAIAAYLAAEAADPALAEVQKKLGLSYQLKGDTRRAADRYRRYLATGPADADRVRAILSTLE